MGAESRLATDPYLSELILLYNGNAHVFLLAEKFVDYFILAESSQTIIQFDAATAARFIIGAYLLDTDLVFNLLFTSSGFNKFIRPNILEYLDEVKLLPMPRDRRKQSGWAQGKMLGKKVELQ